MSIVQLTAMHYSDKDNLAQYTLSIHSPLATGGTFGVHWGLHGGTVGAMGSGTGGTGRWG